MHVKKIEQVTIENWNEDGLPLLVIEARIDKLETEFFRDPERFKKWLMRNLNQVKLKKPRGVVRWR